MDIVYALEIGAVAAVAAILGSMLGLGGGVFLVPILTLFFGVDPKLAVGASAIVVVTNSVVGSTNHLKNRFTNLRLAMLLQVSTALGAIAGALYGVAADPRVIYGVFGAVLVYAAVSMVIRRERAVSAPIAGAADELALGAAFSDPAIGRDVGYIPIRPAAGMGVGAGAGIISGMLGVGGVLKVTLAKDGTWAGGSLIGTQMVRGGIPELDPNRRAVAFVDGLSREDFGANAATISAGDGSITPPATG